jgi:hypothetical protein
MVVRIHQGQLDLANSAQPFCPTFFPSYVPNPRSGSSRAGRCSCTHDLWEGVNGWGFGHLGETSEPIMGHLAPADYLRVRPGAWEYHLTAGDAVYDNSSRTALEGISSFAFSISILFPPSDLAVVTEAIHEHALAEAESE